MLVGSAHGEGICLEDTHSSCSHEPTDMPPQLIPLSDMPVPPVLLPRRFALADMFLPTGMPSPPDSWREGAGRDWPAEGMSTPADAF